MHTAHFFGVLLLHFVCTSVSFQVSCFVPKFRTPKSGASSLPNIRPSIYVTMKKRQSIFCNAANKHSEDEPDRTNPFFRSDNATRDSEFLVGKGINSNNFYKMISTLTPGELVGQFIDTASPRVQGAVKNTVLGLMGSLRTLPLFDSQIVTTQRALANMMFQLEMTGYMFRNAEYRLAVQQSLSRALSSAGDPAGTVPDGERLSLRVSGQITVHLPSGGEVQVDADSYVSELSREVQRLRSEMLALRQVQSDSMAQDLMAYISAMDTRDQSSLTGGVSTDVLDAMHLLVNSVMRSVDAVHSPSADTSLAVSDQPTEVSSNALSQLCLWQLVVGYTLRELEVREEFNRAWAATE